MIDFKIKRRYLNFHFYISILLLTILGAITLYSSTATFPSLHHLWTRHLIFTGISITLFLFIQIFDWKRLQWMMVVFYIISLLMLVAVLFFGVRVFGAQRWLNLGIVNLQPSEFAKVGLVLFLSYLLAQNHQYINSGKFLAGYFLVIAPPVFLIFKQPDLGTALALFPMFIALLFFAGISSKTLIKGFILVLIVGSVSFPFTWQRLPSYQKERIHSFIYPEQYPLSKSYNMRQAKIAIGSGKATGKGFLQGTQVNNRLLPAHYTDFIFSGYAEQFGFRGSLLLLLCFFYFITVLFLIAFNTSHTFGKFVAAGTAMLITTQIIINIAVNLALMPVTGITLPFMSYGGSSSLTIFILLGIIRNIHTSSSEELFD